MTLRELAWRSGAVDEFAWRQTASLMAMMHNTNCTEPSQCVTADYFLRNDADGSGGEAIVEVDQQTGFDALYGAFC